MPARASRSSFPRCIRATRARSSERMMTNSCRACRRWRCARAVRHRLEHRCGRSRPARNFARSARSPCLRSGAGRLGRHWLRRAGVSKARPLVIDYLIDLARRSRQRLMVRLVKGAYWDSEIKRAQVDGLRRLSGVHAQDLHRYFVPGLREEAARRRPMPSIRNSPRITRSRFAAIYQLAGQLLPGQYEFQCLHGMGETAVRASRRRATS